MKAKQITRNEAIDKLNDLLKPGDVVFTKIKHVSKSGMSRVMDVYVIRENEPLRITWSVAEAISFTYNSKHEGVKAEGCGMDMGFEVVYQLGRVMFPDGFGVAGKYPNGSDGRPTTKEMAAKAVETGAKFYGRNGDATGWDNDGGYALKQRWL